MLFYFKKGSGSGAEGKHTAFSVGQKEVAWVFSYRQMWVFNWDLPPRYWEKAKTEPYMARTGIEPALLAPRSNQLS